MKPTRNPNVQTKLLPDGHVVLFSEQTDWAHTLTPLAGIAWEFCDGSRTVAEIVGCVAETAGVNSPDSIRADLDALFESLTSSGLVNITT